MAGAEISCAKPWQLYVEEEFGGCPVGVGAMGDVAESEGFGFLAKQGKVGEIEPADEEASALAELFPQCDKISIDYAVMETIS